jgi:hypothetical protein
MILRRCFDSLRSDVNVIVSPRATSAIMTKASAICSIVCNGPVDTLDALPYAVGTRTKWDLSLAKRFPGSRNYTVLYKRPGANRLQATKPRRAPLNALLGVRRARDPTGLPARADAGPGWVNGASHAIASLPRGVAGTCRNRNPGAKPGSVVALSY